MWFVTLVLLAITVILALWGLDEKAKFERLESKDQNKKN